MADAVVIVIAEYCLRPWCLIFYSWKKKKTYLRFYKCFSCCCSIKIEVLLRQSILPLMKIFIAQIIKLKFQF